MYLWDYCRKHNYQNTANSLAVEAGLQTDQPLPIDAPEGFLYEWWSVFWDIFYARVNKTGSEAATAYVEVL
jgi:hypothetical protein